MRTIWTFRALLFLLFSVVALFGQNQSCTNPILPRWLTLLDPQPSRSRRARNITDTIARCVTAKRQRQG